jgi:hypothetical protein
MVLQLEFGVKEKNKHNTWFSNVKLGLDTLIEKYHVVYKLLEVNLY